MCTIKDDASSIFSSIVEPWYDSLKNPNEAQIQVLKKLVSGYEKTEYGQKCKASSIQSIEEFRVNFPVLSYEKIVHYLSEVQRENYKVFLPEPLVCWVMTRGSTGRAKVLPATKTHLQQIFNCGARALVNFALKKGDLKLLSGKILNSNFPSTVHTMVVNE